MTKTLCSICYKNKATEIDNLYCESCLEILIEELNNVTIIKPNKNRKSTSNTIESEYFTNKYKKKNDTH